MFTNKVLTIGLVIMLIGAGVGFLAGVIQGGDIGMRMMIGLGAGMVVAALALGFYVVMRTTDKARREHEAQQRDAGQ